ncbi:MAG: amidohydrolase family protein [Caulobacteraceae bacterium]
MRPVAILLATAMLASTSAAARAAPIAIVGARAYTLTADVPIKNATIVVDAGRVVSVSAGGPPPAGAEVIDAHGQIVTPGLMLGAGNLGLVEINDTADTNDTAVSKGALGPAFDVQYALNPNSTLIPLARADGLTRAGVAPAGSASPPFSGQAAVVRLSEGPDILDKARAAMFVQVGGFAAAKVGGSRAAAWGLIRNALDEARRFAKERAGGGPRDQVLDRPDAKALQGVLSGAMPMAVMASRESDIRQAVQLGRDYGIKVIIVGGAEAWRAADLLARQHVAVVLDPYDDLPWTFDELGSRLANAAILDRAGVAIAFTVPGIPDYNPGSGAREAAGLAVANGLPWIEGLRALTLYPARMWGVADHYGQIASGKDADLVIWDGDPLDPRSAPTLVMVRGRQVSLETRQSLLTARYLPSRKRDGWPPAYP